MKRLIDIPDELDSLLINESVAKGFPITQIIKQILWQWAEIQSKIKAT